MTPPPVRKPHRFGGVQVRICGKSIQGSVICQLPPGKHSIHAGVATTDDGAIYALAVNKNSPTEVASWQLADPHE